MTDKIIKRLNEEIEFAKGCGVPQFVMGLSQAKKVIEDEFRETVNTTQLIKQWAKDRNLHTADPNKQMLKLMEEVGELAAGMARGDDNATRDGIGDTHVVLTILSEQLGYNIENCIDQAYNEIKDRKGKMINGVFVKESDLVKE